MTFLISFVLCTAAFTKMITINGQEYHLQLVDTAGQVRVSVPSQNPCFVSVWFLKID